MLQKLMGLVALILVTCAAAAAEKSVQETELPVPEGVSEAIAATLQPEAVQILEDGKPLWEFWFVKETPLKQKPASETDALSAIPEAALLGVVRVHQPQRDYRDDEVYEDVYTLRFLLQPQDGNHLGTADYAYFAVLVPVAKDQAPGQLKDYDAVVEASRADTATDHPIVLSLRPLDSKEGVFPGIASPASEHQALRISLPATAEGAPAAAAFALVFEGHGKL